MSEKPSLHEMFEAATDEFLKFRRIKNPLHPRPDLCGFLMLHDLVPGKTDMISSACHDEYFLSVDCEKLHAVVTQEQVIDLHRCGIRYDEEYDSLAVFS